jgi:uncharacterized DUF497 family protein
VVTWDEPKRLANLDEHELDFEDFEAAFLGATTSLFRPTRVAARAVPVSSSSAP